MQVENYFQYAIDVVDGKKLVTPYVKKQCILSLEEYNRQDNDDFKWFYDEERAKSVITFFGLLPHVKGHLAGSNLVLESWQKFLLSQIYGWRSKEDPDVRKFKTVICEVPRKNGKSFLCSGLSLYELAFGDKGGEVYSIATKADQAKIVWKMAYDQISLMPKQLSSYYHRVTTTISSQKGLSTYKYVGRDSDTQDGLNPSLVICDEAAAIKDRNVIEVMESGMGARKSPLFFYITTAQFTQTTKYYEDREYCKSVLDGRIENDRMFGLIYSLDRDADITDEENWERVNPNLGVSLQREFLKEQVSMCLEIPSRKNQVLIKHFNIFTSTSCNWISLDKWRENKRDLKREGPMYIGWDLAQTRDLCVVCRIWHCDDGYEVDFKCFLPKKSLDRVPAHEKNSYMLAVETGVLHLTEGEVTNYNEIYKYIESSCDEYELESIGGDPYNANSLIFEIQEELGFEFNTIGQGITSMNAPSKETERLICENKIFHEDNQFINWQIENAEVYKDVNENIKVRKGEDPNKKIDAVIAMICGISMCALGQDEEKEFEMVVIKNEDN